MTDYFMMKARESALAVADERDAYDWHDMDALTALARTLEALDTERAAHEATKEAIKRQAAAVRTLQACEQSEINILRKERHKAHEAIKTLESERAANALLTDELEATKADSFDRGWNAAIEAAKALVDGYDMFDTTMRRSNKDLAQAISQLKKDTGNLAPTTTDSV